MNITNLVPDDNGLVNWPTLSVNRKSVVTVGSFDGMHQGHRAVIGRTVELAKRNNAFSVVILFNPRPSIVHQYAKTHQGQQAPADIADPEQLMSIDQRLRVMDELGVDHVLLVQYTLAFAAKSFRFFLGQLVGKLGMRTLVLGQDAHMGAGRTGDVKAIENLALATGVFELDIVDDRGPGYTRIPKDISYTMPQEPGEPNDPTAGMTKAQLRAWSKRHQAQQARVWSSSNVRYLLSQGRIKDADAILGAPHAIEGTVVHGEQRGRGIGFPTANLGAPIDGYLPVDGVYAGWLVDLGEPEHDEADGSAAAEETSQADTGTTNGTAPVASMPRPLDLAPVRSRLAPHSPWRWPAAISIGTKPTFETENGEPERVVEAYAVTDDWLDLYGHRVRIEFTGFLRPQIKFDSVDALKAELATNAKQAEEAARNAR
ncbi:bifunctional riboflavin kinase/FMN adenylyltransferase [Bifidobacterium thermophilum]|uniref:Bifunctional riboflavin kinase/FMN adenylyltransferase n=1 Tax=Bifidobacterium thermophilum TaxID=33905 RepID=A0A7X9NPB9_9BIFI|nr:riboflavin kinase [Bifidobacterium thermophilum]NME61326.1 bifunctional riboflavin kinase/FMN adenylyltransferase [Bifidobacterium thermophilum]